MQIADPPHDLDIGGRRSSTHKRLKNTRARWSMVRQSSTSRQCNAQQRMKRNLSDSESWKPQHCVVHGSSRGTFACHALLSSGAATSASVLYSPVHADAGAVAIPAEMTRPTMQASEKPAEVAGVPLKPVAAYISPYAFFAAPSDAAVHANTGLLALFAVVLCSPMCTQLHTQWGHPAHRNPRCRKCKQMPPPPHSRQRYCCVP